MKTGHLLSFLALAAFITGCKDKDIAYVSTSPYLDLKGMDTLVSLADDFAQYSSGKWLKVTEIPEKKASWGTWS